MQFYILFFTHLIFRSRKFVLQSIAQWSW